MPRTIFRILLHSAQNQGITAWEHKTWIWEHHGNNNPFQGRLQGLWSDQSLVNTGVSKTILPPGGDSENHSGVESAVDPVGHHHFPLCRPAKVG
jgi:hypothetical protein